MGDTDVLGPLPSIPERSYCWAEQESNIINGAVLKFPEGDPLCERLFALSAERAPALTEFGQLGPALLTEVLGEQAVSGLWGCSKEIYPLHWLQAHFVRLPEFHDVMYKACSDARFMHFWN